MSGQFKSGFVNLIGLPNSGKSTLINALTGEKMAIISPKPQTTRQRILGLINESDFQIIFSDTPGFIDQTNYPLHLSMNLQVYNALEDADCLILVIDSSKDFELPEAFVKLLHPIKVPIIICLNKVDLSTPQRIAEIEISIQHLGIPHSKIINISAIKNLGIDTLLAEVKKVVPEHPAYYPDDIISNRPIRFFISELIREQLFKLYDAEIPYHCFVTIESCKGVDDQLEMAVIYANIYVGKQSQVPILIGKGGSKLKELGIRSRTEIEKYLGQKVYLSLSIKLRKDWRNNESFITKSSIFQ